MMRSLRAEERQKPFIAFFMALLFAVMSMAAVPVQAQSAAGMPDFTDVVARTEGSVVNIRTMETVPVRQQSPMGPNGDPYELFRWFFGPDFVPPGAQRQPQPQPAPPSQDEQKRTVPSGIGSGFIISDDGYILTNTHVVKGATEIFVTFPDKKEYKAKVIGVDNRTDVALIKIDAKGLKPLPIGDSSKLRKGQWVLAIGSPFGLESTVTAGIVSAINRDTGDYLPFIQTDVAVNPGNSGGPLLNLNGEVVGINSQIVSQSGGFMGISLAIPIDEAMQVVKQLKEHGKVTRGRIGVQIGPVAEDVAKAIGLDKAMGAMVSNVDPDGPAAEAGVQPGDVITHFNGKAIDQWSDLPRIVGETHPGTRADLKVWRKGKEVTLKAKVGEFDAEPTAAPGQAEKPKATTTDALGLQVSALTPEVRKREKVKNGVLVTAASGPAASVGIAPGDVILTLNDVDVTDPAQFAKLVSGLSKGKAAALLVQREGQSQWVVVTPAK